MNRSTTLRATFAMLIIVLGNLQAWDSHIHDAGMWIVLLVSLAVALPAVALLLPLQQNFFLAAFLLALILLVIARAVSSIPLPGLFIILIPALMGLLYMGILEGKVDVR